MDLFAHSNAIHAAIDRRATDRTCGLCGDGFVDRSPAQKARWCSGACKQKAYREGVNDWHGRAEYERSRA